MKKGSGNNSPSPLRCSEVRPRGHTCLFTGSAQRKSQSRARIHVRTRGGAFQAGNPTGSKLVVATKLSTDHDARWAGAGSRDAGCHGRPRKRVLHKLQRIGEVLVGPTAAEVRTEVAAGPRKGGRGR